MKDTRVNLRISESVKEQLSNIAKSNNSTVSDVIRDIIDEKLLENNEEDFERVIMEQKAQRIIESLSSKKSMYFEGNSLNAKIFYEDFKVELCKASTDKIANCSYFISIDLYRNNKTFMNIALTKFQKFEFKYGGFLHILC